jgi:hypothetical protein
LILENMCETIEELEEKVLENPDKDIPFKFKN